MAKRKVLAVPLLSKTETGQRVTYTGLDDLVGMTLTVEKAVGIEITQFIPTALLSKTWQQLCAEIESENTII